jgi:threonine dehydratase
MPEPTIDTIRMAADRIRPHVHRTPVMTSHALDRMYGAHIHFKCENLQKAGAFKTRGATNAVFSLTDEEAAKGVATHSSGNFAGAMALAASWRGIPAYVVMPTNSTSAKREAARGYGAKIIDCEPTLEARESGLAAVVERTGATFLHPYNDHTVIAGQGTAGLELCEDVPALEMVIAPVGGGGLISGTAIAVTGTSPGTLIYGAEPAMADDAARSLAEGRIVPSVNPDTVCDGLRTSLGDLTFPIIRKYVANILIVGEEDVILAMRDIWERMKIIVEPSSAIALAAVKLGAEVFGGRKVGVILSGGNVDLSNLPF